ncbi:hypothetical protein AN396_07080 [Candidatus Epulonipiscium fishelsonii]|uniref:Uncharacterized protein n=1 Tax=Candidatus Epulonipiscium fishelsonii TaxID=77094 RepID=A0ACC8XB88_9FIRM|nr:hypothetical protein AN396_07080 [Epulopiscium sp. SCG-B11WGA-EpuloA1]
MRLVSVNKLRLDSKIAVDIYDNYGQIILYKNTNVTQPIIHKLDYMNIEYIYITDEYCLSNPESLFMAQLDNMGEVISKLEELGKASFEGTATEEIVMEAYFTVEDIVEELFKKKEYLKIRYIPDKMTGNTTAGTIIYMSIMTAIFGIKAGLAKEEVENLFMASLLKDVGIISPYLKNLQNAYQLHPALAYNYLSKKYFLHSDVLVGILHHHEMIDGTGFPQKLQGHSIHKFAKIIQLMEMFFELKLSHKILGNMNTQLKPKLSELFKKYDVHFLEILLDNTEFFSLDTMVELSNGDIGVVVKNRECDVFFPAIQIIKTKSEKFLLNEVIDLEKFSDIEIERIIYYLDNESSL